MTLEELTPWLFVRTAGGIRWGLERTEDLLAGVGDPHRHFRAIHIGGTNGKGSVAALCDAALRARGGGRVGLYTSPHLVSFNERIRIDGSPVSDAALLRAAERLRPGIERSGATFFEATTAIAFLAFAEAGVDLAVVEVGLGGRLDATNVIAPLAAGVTNVAVDHTDYLGDELEGIAVEKAGIIKTGVPILVGVREPGLAEVFRRQALGMEAPYHALDEMMTTADVRVKPDAGTTFVIDSAAWGRQRLETRLLGEHQARNASFAAELLGLLPDDLRPTWDAIERGFRQVSWAGRLQLVNVRGTTYVLDVAHNPDGARTLAASLTGMDLPEPRVLVAGILADKDWREMLGHLVPGAAAAILTCPASAPASRLWDPTSAAAWCQATLGIVPRVIPDLGAALSRASTLAPYGTIVVTGSIHTVGDAIRELEIRVV